MQTFCVGILVSNISWLSCLSTVPQDANYSPPNLESSLNMSSSTSVLNTALPALSQRFQTAHLQSFARCSTAFPNVSGSGGYLPSPADWSTGYPNTDGTITSYVSVNATGRNRGPSVAAGGMPYSAAGALQASKYYHSFGVLFYNRLLAWP